MTQLVASSVLPPQAGFSLPDTHPATILGIPEAQVRVESSGRVSIVDLTLEDTEQLLDWLENHGVTGCECSPQMDGYLTVRWTDWKSGKSG